MTVDPEKYGEHFPRNCPAIMGQYPAGYDFVANGYGADINVWNCQATLWLGKGDVKISEDDIAFSEKDRECLAELVMDSIESGGGAINCSGQYAISPKLQRFIMSKRFVNKLQHAFEVATEKAKVNRLIREVEKQQEARKHYNKIMRDVFSLLDRDTAMYTIDQLQHFQHITPEEAETLKQLAQYMPVANEETRQTCEAMAFGSYSHYGPFMATPEEEANAKKEFENIQELCAKYPHLIKFKEGSNVFKNWAVELTPQGEQYHKTGLQMKCMKENKGTYLF